MSSSPRTQLENDSTAKSRNESDDAFPYRQLTILAICRFSEPIAFNSILAYTYLMVVDLNGGDETNASFYSGMLVSAYPVAEALTAMIWGSASDKYGRKPIILLGLLGVALSCLMLGFAQTYRMAFLARVIGGCLNGNVSVMMTAVAECVKRPEHEPRAYATQPFVWVLGAILGSALGGFLAQPAKFYPDVFPADGLFGRFPYLLPNLVAVATILLAVLQGALFLDETNEAVIRFRHSVKVNSSANETTPLLSQQDESVIGHLRRHISRDGVFIEDDAVPTATDPTIDIRHSALPAKAVSNSSSSATVISEEREYTNKETFNYTVVVMVIALTTVAFHQMAYAAIIPIYLLDPPSEPHSPLGDIDLRGGMGFTLHDVGGVLAINGFIALFIQGIVFPLFVERVGVYRSFFVTIIGYPLCYVFLPFLTMLREPDLAGGGITEMHQPWYLSAGIFASMTLQNLFGIISVPCATILLKNATPSKSVLGRVNGLAMSAVCAARTISSPLVGVIYDQGGSSAAWAALMAMAVVGGLELWFVRRDEAEGKRHVALKTSPGSIEGGEQAA